jgi:NAD(P)-dependent dehydrogenase (short-subunit alcohol dehydrogenase family)
MELKDSVVIVTGASRGIGAAFAVELARRGAKVACAARGDAGAADRARLPGALEDTVAAVEAAGGQALGITTDVGREEDVLRMVETTRHHFGRIDGLVNNAAYRGAPSTIESDLGAADDEYNVNFRGPLVAIRAVLPHLRAAGGGAILNVSSLMALNYLDGRMMYGVTKMALERLTMDVAIQLAKDNIACNAFRIDLPVFPEDRINDPSPIVREFAVMAEPPLVAAQAMAWMLSQPSSYTGRLEGMRALMLREGAACAESRAQKEVPLSRWERWSW